MPSPDLVPMSLLYLIQATVRYRLTNYVTVTCVILEPLWFTSSQTTGCLFGYTNVFWKIVFLGEITTLSATSPGRACRRPWSCKASWRRNLRGDVQAEWVGFFTAYIVEKLFFGASDLVVFNVLWSFTGRNSKFFVWTKWWLWLWPNKIAKVAVTWAIWSLVDADPASAQLGERHTANFCRWPGRACRCWCCNQGNLSWEERQMAPLGTRSSFLRLSRLQCSPALPARMSTCELQFCSSWSGARKDAVSGSSLLRAPRDESTASLSSHEVPWPVVYRIFFVGHVICTVLVSVFTEQHSPCMIWCCLRSQWFYQLTIGLRFWWAFVQ